MYFTALFCLRHRLVLEALCFGVCLSVHVCILKTCKHNIIKTAPGNFTEFAVLVRAPGDKYELIRSWGQKVKVKVTADMIKKAEAYTLMACHWPLNEFVSTSWYSPLRSARQHLSYGDCLEVKREYYHNCFVLDCVTQCLQSTAHLVSSSYRSNRLGLSHWDPYAVRRGGCLEL